MLQKLLLAAFGVGAGLGLAGLLVALFPSLVPGLSERPYANQTREIFYYSTDGDLFALHGENIRPPDDNVLLAAYVLRWDADGFRMPLHEADHYPIVALGDSFTEGANVPLPWPDALARTYDVPVRNLGYRGYGPIEYARVASEFVARHPRDWVLVMHFAGNDMLNAELDEADLIDERRVDHLLPFLVERAQNALFQPTPNPDAHYDYPMPVIIGGHYHELAFLDAFIWHQIAPEGGFQTTRAYATIGDSLRQIETASPGACHALIFAPTKGQLYYPYVHDGVRQYLRRLSARFAIQDDGRLQLEPFPVSAADEADLIARFDDQRDALARLAEQHGWYFIDLLEPFRARVAQGDLLYYRYDTHWNQAGHDLAARIIADALRAVPGCTSYTPVPTPTPN